MRLRFHFLLWGAIISDHVCAGSNSSNMQVNATVVNNCTIAANSMNFSNFSGATLGTPQTPVSAPLTVQCTSGVTYRVALGPGTTSGATTTSRKMSNGSNTLGYALFQNSTYTQNWGNTANTDDVGGTGNGNSQTLTVYGSIPTNYSAPQGSYSDTVQATVNF